jgi:hypothetical protein
MSPLRRQTGQSVDAMQRACAVASLAKGLIGPN